MISLPIPSIFLLDFTIQLLIRLLHLPHWEPRQESIQ